MTDERKREEPPAVAGLIVEALEHPAVAMLEDSDGRRWTVPRAWLPGAAREGDVLALDVRGDGDGTRRVALSVDESATRERRRAIEERHERLPRAPEGDLDL